MLKAIIQFSIKNKFVVFLFLIALIVFGAISFKNLPIDAVPDITNNQVLIITYAPSLGAPDVEKFITIPIEQGVSNIPGLIEKRSLSRFGLSIITLVFNDNIDVYWARQQVSERLNNIRQMIPANVGNPTLGPVTTGLGEIYQYSVHATKGYEHQYSLMQLRDIQDWIIRMQLLGTPGVADVSTLGGDKKEYEVAVNTNKLNSYGLNITDIFNALAINNNNTGGGYIEKGPTALFIRTDGLDKSINDIENTVIAPTSYMSNAMAQNIMYPILIKDIAEVKIGRALRYGAMIEANYGEVTGAVVMMLKGENSNKVIQNIKNKIADIQKRLPKGVVIEPFLDRTKMVNQSINTVKKNLEEGALIVIFVLVIFLGNIRAGLLVASVIPLSMLFAVILMNAFGVSGNLMSLGALDFGLLVDGAVIIVEAIMHQLSHHKEYRKIMHLDTHQMNDVVSTSSFKMMRSASFGQFIILIVYIPILSLQDIEGKMFRPMAETVGFAIIGAFILSITYIPMMSALFLSKKIPTKKNISDKMIEKIEKIYRPILQKALHIPYAIIIIAFVMFLGAIYMMSKLGGEFIPKLPEGDLAIDTRMLPGTGLTKTVATFQQIADTLKKDFPEINTVVSKIGSGDIPTDPQTIDAGDIIVNLKPKEEWPQPYSWEEITEAISNKVNQNPYVNIGIQYPVQMRFNELMTGSKQDVTCKIFGNDLDSLSVYANKVATIAKTINGVKDIYVETVAGVPQLVITYHKAKLALYGTNINDINNIIQSSFSGGIAGAIYENERRYDLVVRLNEKQRDNLQDIKNMIISLPNGRRVPLPLLADINIKLGAYEIKHEEGFRKIETGFNVRGTDVQTVIKELQTKVDKKINLPAGYYMRYTGEYENLQRASQRLIIAVPISLILIFLILFFNFRKLKYCIIIFTAIPLSSIGGVLYLSLRHMPFSISAGIGFIALFGVAVLNGIVLVAEMNKIKEESMLHTSIKDIILQATALRLRPVLMTACVASLGFLPMALSTGPGAEVQRPLATVVIGGLISATLLTLFVLPCLYYIIERHNKKISHPLIIAISIILLASISTHTVYAQDMDNKATAKMSLQTLIDRIPNHSISMTVAQMREKYFSTMQKTYNPFPSTQFSTSFGNVNSPFFDIATSVNQTFVAPTFYKKQKNLFESYLETAKAETQLRQIDMRRIIEQLYIQLEWVTQQDSLLKKIDTIYSHYKAIANARYKTGETDLLEKVSLDNTIAQNKILIEQEQADKKATQLQISTLLQLDTLVIPSETLSTHIITFDSALLAQHPSLLIYEKQLASAKAATALEKVKLYPTFNLGITNQSYNGYVQYNDQQSRLLTSRDRFTSGSMGISVPIFTHAERNQIKASEINQQVVQAQADEAKTFLTTQYEKLEQDYHKFNDAIAYYQSSALPTATILLQTVTLQYQKGQINYIQWSSFVNQAMQTQFSYMNTLYQKSITESELNYLINQPPSNNN